MWNVGHLRQVRIAEDAAPLRRRGVIPAGGHGVTQTGEDVTLAEAMRAVIDEAEGVFPLDGDAPTTDDEQEVEHQAANVHGTL